MTKIILSADSTCDLDDYLRNRYNVNIAPLHIVLKDKAYQDGVDITTEDILKTYRQHNILQKQ